MEEYRIESLTFAYPEGEPVLRGVTASVESGSFVTLCGPSGCGKSTLLRQLKPVMAPHGERSGEIFFEGAPVGTLDARTQASRIGFVQQSPENQIVTDKVWHELAFGLESLGLDTPAIRARVAEMASFFGIQTWFYKNVTELSGGQKQLLSLASIMAMQPSVLILDEPTSQLDPIAAADFLSTVGRINRELGTTVIMTEHRLEDVFPMSDRVLVMDGGRIIADGAPAEIGAALRRERHSMFYAMPSAMRVWAAVPGDRPCPVTVRDGRSWLEERAEKNGLLPVPEREYRSGGETVVSLEDVWFKYEKNAPDIVKGLSLELRRGELFALLGGNGTGKTTTLSLIAGLQKPYRGTVRTDGRVGVLPQNPQALFVKKTVREDLLEIFSGTDVPKNEREARAARAVQLCRLEKLLDRHPYDLSGGEQQRAALAKVLLLDPEILLMDEPTKGLDAEFKRVFAQIVKTLQRRGVTVFMVSHDVEFCAEYADRCAMFFDGSVTALGTPRAFFSGNSFYTTSVNRMARAIAPDAVTVPDLIRACGGEPEPDPALDESAAQTLPPPEKISADDEVKKLPRWRKLIAAVSGLGALAIFIRVLSVTDLSQLISGGYLTDAAKGELLPYALLILCLFVFAMSISVRTQRKPSQPRQKRKLAKRTVLASVLILLLIPVTLFVGVRCFGGRKYYAISLLIMAETMLPFFLVFEGRRPQARELVTIASLCAVTVAGRALFFMLPEFKPVVAMTIIAGVAFGGETGFLVGSVSMLVSNMLFSQGPWTPWQMFAMGIIGFLAGVLYRRGMLGRSRLSLCIFGAIVSVVVYGGIMNPASAIMWSNEINTKILLSYYVTGLPVDLVRAAATWLFLWLGAEPMLEKLDRIKTKYGLVE